MWGDGEDANSWSRYLQCVNVCAGCRCLCVLPAGVFAEGGLRDYLAYVRSSSSYSSRFVASTFEWRDDVPDGVEVSIYQPAAGEAQQ